MDRLTSMAVFARCAQAGSLTGAARALDLSHSMVRKHVRSLERDLGVRLLDITTRRLGLTEAGRRYLARCEQILSEVEDAAAEASQYQAAPRGLLRITAPAAFGRLHLAPAIAAFMERYAEIAVEAQFTDQFADLVEEGWDVAVRIGRLPDSSLIARRLASCRMLTCAAPAYLERAGTPAHPEDLRDHPCFCLSTISTPGVWHFRDPAGGELHVNVSGRLRSDSMDLLCAAAERGLGIVHGPSFILRPLVQAGRLEPILALFTGMPLDISAVLPSNRLRAAKAQILLDFLAERFAGKPWEYEAADA